MTTSLTAAKTWPRSPAAMRLASTAPTLSDWRARRAPAPGLAPAEIELRIAARLDARKAKNFAEADRIRDELAALGVVLKDSKDGTTWEAAR